DQGRYQSVAREHAGLTQVVSAYREYQKISRELEEAEALSREADPEIRELAATEKAGLIERQARLGQAIERMLIPKDPRDERNVIVEIRAGAGGDEAALFAGDLLRMYTRYAERHGWKSELLSGSPTGLGGFKEAALAIGGRGAYSRLKYESG